MGTVLSTMWTGDINLSYLTAINEKYSFNAFAETVFTGNRVDLSFPAGVTDTQTPLPSYTLTNVRAGVPARGGRRACFCVNNAPTKQASLDNMIQLPLSSTEYNRVETNQPLTVGVDLSYLFR